VQRHERRAVQRALAAQRVARVRIDGHSVCSAYWSVKRSINFSDSWSSESFKLELNNAATNSSGNYSCVVDSQFDNEPVRTVAVTQVTVENWWPWWLIAAASEAVVVVIMAIL